MQLLHPRRWHGETTVASTRQMQRRERNARRMNWRKKRWSKQAWFPCWDLARSGNILCFTLIPALAVTFVGQAYLLESPKTALALLTAIPSKVLIERHKCNSEKKQWDRRKIRQTKRESKAQRKERKTLQWKITLKPAHQEAWQSQLRFLQASQTTDSETTLWSGIVSPPD